MPTPMAARTMWVNGPIIVGAGPAGLSVAACLRSRGVPSVVLDRADCIASLWQRRTYDRLRLHLPKRFCELPGMPFPDTYPEYPTKHQFVAYLEAYAARFHVRPRFNQAVVSARFDHAAGLWRVRAAAASTTTNNDVAGTITITEYVGRWLVVATGENAERIVPDFDGAESFSGPVTHVSEYKSGEAYRGKRVLVVGCGNSGMEVCLDLCEHNASPSMVVRDSVHVLPREMLGVATFSVAIFLLRILPLWLVDKILIVLAGVFLGNLGKLGLRRPSKGGPLELKNTKGRTPVLDIGALARIRSGDIKVVPGIRRFRAGGAELVDSRFVAADAVILATGYHSNVPQWLQGSDFFTGEGYPKVAFPEGWKGGSGLYSVGFTRRGLSGVSLDAVRVASDIAMAYNSMSSSSSSSSSCAASSSTAGSSCSSSTSCSSSASSSSATISCCLYAHTNTDMMVGSVTCLPRELHPQQPCMRHRLLGQQ